jgi:hypothetical protein
MVYTGVLATESELNAMAGENVDTTGWTEANKNSWMKQIEGYLCAVFNFDLVSNYSSLDPKAKYIFSEYCARYCAICGITFNMNSFTSRIEAESMINVHVWRLKQLDKIIMEDRFRQYIRGSS